MTSETATRLRALLEAQYDAFRRRLTRHLGSEDLARDTLQETWLRLGQVRDGEILRRPQAYIFRVALNAAAQSKKNSSRKLSSLELNQILSLPDGAFTPERSALGMDEIKTLQRALEELPQRRRDIFHMALLRGEPHAAIAERFGVSTRLVKMEIRKALSHCSARLERNSPRPFPFAPSKPSKD